MHQKSTRVCPVCGNFKSPSAKTCRSCYLPQRPLIDNGDGTHTVPLTRNAVALIESADAELVGPFTWVLSSGAKRPDYAVTRSTGATVYLHRLILGAGAGDFVDHINRDGLDCRRSNLRFATPQGNMANVARRRSNPCPFKGVRPRCDGKKWTARVQFNGRGIHLGSFDTAEDAARAYDAKAVELFGEFAGLNFPADMDEAA